MVRGQRQDAVLFPSWGQHRGAEVLVMCFLQELGALRVPSCHCSGDALRGCRPYPHPHWDPHLCCSPFSLELHGILPHSCGVLVWDVRVHPPRAMLVTNPPARRRYEVILGRSGEGGVPMVTDSDSPDRAGWVFRPFIPFFWSRARSQRAEGAMAQPRGGETQGQVWSRELHESLWSTVCPAAWLLPHT